MLISTNEPVSEDALSAVAAILERGEDADDVLREVVEALVAEPGVVWAGIAFVEDGSLVLGPESGVPAEERRGRTSIRYEGAAVGELLVDGDAEQEVLDRIAALVSPYVLIGWDTRGQTWAP